MPPSFRHLALILTLGALATAHPLAAQDIIATRPTLPAQDSSSPPHLPRWYAGVAADVGRPTGAFRQQVPHATGATGHLRLRLDPAGRFSLRLEGGYLNYGHESQRTCLANTPACRIAVNVTTANGILSGAIGPELSLPLGPVRAFAHGLVGASRFATFSGLGGGLLPDFVAADEHFGDGGVVWGAGAGLSAPVSRSVSVDVGASFQGHGRRDYLIKGGVTDNPDGTLDFDVKRSRTNLLSFRIGVTTALTRKSRS
jgi:hypothetical protein